MFRSDSAYAEWLMQHRAMRPVVSAIGAQLAARWPATHGWLVGTRHDDARLQVYVSAIHDASGREFYQWWDAQDERWHALVRVW